MVLQRERELQENLNISSKNIWNYPAVRVVVVKLAMAYFAGRKGLIYIGLQW